MPRTPCENKTLRFNKIVKKVQAKKWDVEMGVDGIMGEGGGG